MELQGKRGQRWRKRQNSQENLAKWKENTKKRRKTHGKPKKRKKFQKKTKRIPKLTSRPFCLESKRSSTRFYLFFRKLTYHTLGKLKNHLPQCRLRGDLLVPRRVPRLFLPLVHQRFQGDRPRESCEMCTQSWPMKMKVWRIFWFFRFFCCWKKRVILTGIIRWDSLLGNQTWCKSMVISGDFPF